ncbi:hypothetical protein CBA19CS42_40550 [Caballeronia novacaledonica]|uniref:Uncharacterized protein n=1 Tax=Caballeronia novacaledonica TaxID=1544861 RepID=A0AA37ILL1_9BURK|nr:hypothetical protein CBA19CS42_40550 [Caballeronia novacaledonica]
MAALSSRCRTDSDKTPFEKCRILDPRPDTEWLSRAVRNIAGVFPELANVRIAHAWAGAIDTTPDSVVLAGVPGGACLRSSKKAGTHADLQLLVELAAEHGAEFY